MDYYYYFYKGKYPPSRKMYCCSITIIFLREIYIGKWMYFFLQENGNILMSLLFFIFCTISVKNNQPYIFKNYEIHEFIKYTIYNKIYVFYVSCNYYK